MLFAITVQVDGVKNLEGITDVGFSVEEIHTTVIYGQAKNNK